METSSEETIKEQGPWEEEDSKQREANSKISEDSNQLWGDSNQVWGANNQVWGANNQVWGANNQVWEGIQLEVTKKECEAEVKQTTEEQGHRLIEGTTSELH